MTNREKRQYINVLLATTSYRFSHVSEIERWQLFLNKTPRFLYKYRKFDEYSADIFEKEYAFLAPTNTLDDPFDCLAFAEGSKVSDKEALINASTRVIINHCLILVESNKSKSILKPIIKSYLKDRPMLDSSFANQINKLTFLCDDEKELFCEIAPYFKKQLEGVFKDPQRLLFIKNDTSIKIDVGICSLTTKVDNGPMWSLYGDEYRGYCIEYAIPKENSILHSLVPVIYAKRFKHNIYEIDAAFC